MVGGIGDDEDGDCGGDGDDGCDGGDGSSDDDLHGDEPMGQMVVVVGVADPVALPLLRLNLDREHARQGGKGRVEVGGGSGTVDARTRRWKTSWTSLLVERQLVEGSELEDGVAEVGVLLPIPVGAQTVRFKRSLNDLSRLDLQH